MSRTPQLRVVAQASEQLKIDEKRSSTAYVNNTASSVFNRLGSKTGSTSHHHHHNRAAALGNHMSSTSAFKQPVITLNQLDSFSSSMVAPQNNNVVVDDTQNRIMRLRQKLYPKLFEKKRQNAYFNGDSQGNVL